MSIFEIVTSRKSRFPTNRGHINVEQLWDVPIESSDGFNLEAIARSIAGQIESLGTGSILGGTDKKTASAKALLETELEVVKRIYAVKVAEKEAVANRRKNKEKRAKILEALAAREEGDLKSKSKEDLMKELEAIDALEV